MLINNIMEFFHQDSYKKWQWDPIPTIANQSLRVGADCPNLLARHFMGWGKYLCGA
jgi:hypothetical protein